MTEDFLIRAVMIAKKGVQVDDGYNYSVPARDLVESYDTIMSLVAIIEQVRELHEFRGRRSLVDCTCGPSLLPCPTRRVVRG